MTHKTKAEKIAAALRTRKSTGNVPKETPYVAQYNSQQISRKVHTEAHGYHKNDFLKTFAITLLVLSLMAFVYVIQLRGYVR